MRRAAAAFGCLVAVLLVVGGPAAAGAAAGSPGTPVNADVRYEQPVPGTVVRRFEPPGRAFGPGHRGVDLLADPGDGVRVAAAGEVRHAGPVAGVIWVSVAHADGVVTSYGPLTQLVVRAGDRIHGGELVGRLAAGGHGDDGTDRGLHWGARRGAAYLDPLTLLDRAAARPSLVGVGGWEPTAWVVEPYDPWAGGRLAGFGVASSPHADRPGHPVPPNPNRLVLISGLGTSSADDLRLDAAHLGYDAASVTALSYAGRRGGGVGGDPDDARRDQLPYDPSHTWAGVEAASLRLMDQLRAQARSQPGRAVDLVGHSMGGLVALHYLTVHHDPYDPSLPSIGHVVTVASPLAGSDLVSLAAAVRDHRFGAVVEFARAAGEGLGSWAAGSISLTAPALEQLRPDSALVEAVAAAWVAALEADVAGPLATGTRVLTIGGSRDGIVELYRTGVADDGSRTGIGLPRVQHRVLPGGHAGVLETEAIREVMWRFLAGEQVVDSPGVAATWMSRANGGALRLIGGMLRLEDRVPRPRP